MIDCSKTENFLKEKLRMVKLKKGICELDCTSCPFSSHNNGTCESCRIFELLHPVKAIAIVQEWSDAHPPKTVLQDFLEKHPNVRLGDNNIPTLCPYELGYEKFDESTCRKYTCPDCWNRPLSEVTK